MGSDGDNIQFLKQGVKMIFSAFEVDTPVYEDAFRLREDILRKPLGQAITEQKLMQEKHCFHLGGFDGTQLVAVLLLQPLAPPTVKMRQVAVDHELQRSGIGRQLITFAEEFAQQRDYGTMIAHARSTALGFYLRLGYTASGDEFMETTIPHRLVTKTL